MSREQRQKEFSQLETRAYDILEKNDPNPAPFRNANIAIQLWRYPAFANHVSWRVFINHDDKQQVIARQITWLRGEDGRRFADPMEGLKKGWHTYPALLTDDQKLDSQDFTSRMDAGRQIRIPVLRANGRGTILDGTTYGMYYPNGDIRLTWNENYSEEWSELIAWVEDMRTYVAGQFIHTQDTSDKS